MLPSLWVVEIKRGKRWEPTVGVALTRADGRKELAEWNENYPFDRFRLVKYKRCRDAA